MHTSTKQKKPTQRQSTGRAKDGHAPHNRTTKKSTRRPTAPSAAHLPACSTNDWSENKEMGATGRSTAAGVEKEFISGNGRYGFCSCLRRSCKRSRNSRRRNIASGQCGPYAVRYSRRQLIRPLIDSLIGDADCLGRRTHRSAKQLDSFGLSHSQLNHSSMESVNQS